MSGDHDCAEATAIRSHIGAIFVSLELSRARWLVTSLSPGAGEKMSKHCLPAGEGPALLAHLAALRARARERTGEVFPIVVIAEAGLDGFWLHRLLQQEGIESHVVDAASIAVPRRRRRAKTDRIDGETLLRSLLAYQRGEPRVCSMVRAPSPEAEDRRRLCREGKALVAERVRYVNRIKGLLFAQGVYDYEPLRRDRRQRLEGLRTGDGRALPPHLKAEIGRALGRLELLLEQIAAVEKERRVLLERARAERAEVAGAGVSAGPLAPEVPAMLLGLKGIGPDFATTLWTEGLYRHFANRRQVAAYAGLTPSPWQSGTIQHEQGVSKAGNPRLRTAMIQVAWLWLRHQPSSALTRWFHQRAARGPGGRKTAIVALARKLLVALWKYVSAGILIEGARLKEAAPTAV